MNELVSLVDDARAILAREERAVLVTVVRTAGSTYRRPGARMLFPEHGVPVGFVSGGCLEADLAERAAGVFESGEAATVLYDMRSPDDIVWGLGLGCNGEVRVLLERLDPPRLPPHLEFLDRVVRGDTTGVLATVFGERNARGIRVGDRWMRAEGEPGAGDPSLGAIVAGGVRELEASARAASVRTLAAGEGEVDVLLERIAPPRTLVVFGAGRDAVPVCMLAKQVGFRVVVADDRPALATEERFADADLVRQYGPGHLAEAGLPIDHRSAILVMTHHFLRDLEIVAWALAGPAAYVGVLGPARRTEALLRELASRGIDFARARHRLHAPVGIDIGSETPEEIALAAIAEILAVTRGRTASFLRDREGPIHDPP